MIPKSSVISLERSGLHAFIVKGIMGNELLRNCARLSKFWASFEQVLRTLMNMILVNGLAGLGLAWIGGVRDWDERVLVSERDWRWDELVRKNVTLKDEQEGGQSPLWLRGFISMIQSIMMGRCKYWILGSSPSKDGTWDIYSLQRLCSNFFQICGRIRSSSMFCCCLVRKNLRLLMSRGKKPASLWGI